MMVVVAGCSSSARPPEPAQPVPPSAPAEAETPAAVSWPTAEEVPALTRAFYGSLEVIHATSDEPDAEDTPFMDVLQPCQIEPARPLEHPAFARFYPGARFFVSTCADGSFAVVSIDAKRNVHLVALEPHERLYAPAWDEITAGPVTIGSVDDVKLFASAFLAVTYLETVPVAQITVTEKLGTGNWAGTHYYEAKTPRGRSVSLSSKDRRIYSVGSHGGGD